MLYLVISGFVVHSDVAEQAQPSKISPTEPAANTVANPRTAIPRVKPAHITFTPLHERMHKKFTAALCPASHGTICPSYRT